MEKELIISVIVPVFNGEKFIRCAVESVLCQMDGQIELILVNDGSTDSSGMICDEYAAKYPNICVVHKKNGGLSSARNAGIEVAAGQYICFLDADDYLDQETCAELIKVIKAHWPDYIDFGWKYISSCGEITKNLHKLPKNTLLGKEVIKNTVLPPVLNLCKDEDSFIFPFAWNKVYRREIIESNSVSFDENRRTWEDRPFVAHYLKYCRNFYSMDQCFYNYVDVAGSLGRQYNMDFFKIILENYRNYKQLYGAEYDFDVQCVHDYWAQSIENMIFLSLEQKENREIICGNILETLRDEQVIHWFSKRKVNTDFERKIQALMVSGNCQKVLRCYKKKAAQRHGHQVVLDLVFQAKRGIRKVLKGKL